MTNTERRTVQRGLIKEHLDRESRFVTAQQIHDQLRTSGAPVSLPTVYRTLTAMVKAGELDVLTGDQQSFYRRCSAQHHHHLVCRGCGQAIEVAAAPVERWATDVAKQHGFVDITHLSEITGLCRECQELAS